MNAEAKIPQKMNKITHILVCDIRKIDLIKIETTQSVFKIFGNRLQIAFSPYLGKPIFDLGLQNILAGHFLSLKIKFYLNPPL